MIKNLEQNTVLVDYFDKGNKVIHEWITTSPVIQEDIEEIFATSHKAKEGDAIHFEVLEHKKSVMAGDFMRKKDRHEVELELSEENYKVLTKIAKHKNMSLDELISSMAASSADTIVKH